MKKKLKIGKKKVNFIKLRKNQERGGGGGGGTIYTLFMYLIKRRPPKAAVTRVARRVAVYVGHRRTWTDIVLTAPWGRHAVCSGWQCTVYAPRERGLHVSCHCTGGVGVDETKDLLFIYLFIYLFDYLFDYLFIYLFIQISQHPWGRRAWQQCCKEEICFF